MCQAKTLKTNYTGHQNIEMRVKMERECKEQRQTIVVMLTERQRFGMQMIDGLLLK